jgi:hypothetical protein
LTAALLATTGYAQTSPSAPSAKPTEAPSTSKDKGASARSGRVVLKVGNTEVTEEEFETRIGEIEGQGDADREGATAKERKRLGDDFASVLMLSQKAVADHLDATPEVKRKLEIGRIQTLSDAEFASLMDQSKPTYEEIKQYYDGHVGDYDEVQIRRLFIWKQGPESKNKHGLRPEMARARADEILKASAAGADAAPLAEKFKGSNDGLLDIQPLTFPRGELPPAMEKAAFGGQQGKWSQVQDTADSIILVQLLKRDHQQLGQVQSLIEKRLQNQKMQAKLQELKKNAGIWMDERYFGAGGGAEEKPRSSSSMPAKSQDSRASGEGKDE